MERHLLWIGWDLHCSCSEDESTKEEYVDTLIEPIVNEKKHVVGFECLACKTKFTVAQQSEV